MPLKIWLFLACAVFLISQSEGESDFVKAFGQVQKDIQKQLSRYHSYHADKLNLLEVACKGNQSPEKGIIYSVSSGPFQSPVVNKLVTVMSEKLLHVAEIFMDDMHLVTQNVSLVLSERLKLKIASSEEEFNDIKSQIERLAKREAFISIQNHIGNLLASSIAGLKMHLKTITSKPDVMLMTIGLSDHIRILKERIGAKKSCKIPDAVTEEALRKASELSLNITDMKNMLHNMKPSCSEYPEEMLNLLESSTKDNKEFLQRFFVTLYTLELNLSSRLEALNLNLGNESTSTSSVSSSMLPSSTTDLSIDEECIDSTFTGSKTPVPICNSSVQNGKCHLDFVAFHCCRSCRNAGFPTSVSDFKGPRNISILEAIYAISGEIRKRKQQVTTASTITRTTTSTTTTSTTTPPTPVSLSPECINSHFSEGGKKSLPICDIAVRFGKCYLDFIAFHCCRSCSDAGLLTSVPNNYIAFRNVSVLQAMKAINLF